MKNDSKILALVLLAGNLSPAWAHTGQLHAYSFIDGFLHPWSGLDHVLYMFAVGLYVGTVKGKAMFLVPAGFLVFMAFGAGLAYLGIASPAIEGIASSLFVMGILLILKTKASRIILLPLIAYFTLCQGYAHAIEVKPEAYERLYLLGFIGSTALLHTLGLLAGWFGSSKPGYLRVPTGAASIAIAALALVR